MTKAQAKDDLIAALEENAKLRALLGEWKKHLLGEDGYLPTEQLIRLTNDKIYDR